MYKTCTSCGRELPERKESGRLNFVGGICKDRCYSKLKSPDKLTKEDPFSRTTPELHYYEDIGYDCQRNQDILLHGLHA